MSNWQLKGSRGSRSPPWQRTSNRTERKLSLHLPVTRTRGLGQGHVCAQSLRQTLRDCCVRPQRWHIAGLCLLLCPVRNDLSVMRILFPRTQTSPSHGIRIVLCRLSATVAAAMPSRCLPRRLPPTVAEGPHLPRWDGGAVCTMLAGLSATHPGAVAILSCCAHWGTANQVVILVAEFHDLRLSIGPRYNYTHTAYPEAVV